MINREQFAADIYLRLLDSLPAKDPQWLKEEAFRRADDFIAEIEKQGEKQTKTRRSNEKVTA